MFDRDFFEEQPAPDGGGTARAVGAVGAYLLHAVKAMFLLYSAYHGVHAAMSYAAGDVGLIAQIAGIVVIETVLAALYLAWHNNRITGHGQRLAAVVTYAVGFTLACVAIVADSQLTAGLELSPWLAFYLRWGLPIAPALMALGAVLVHELAPEQARRRRAVVAAEELQETKHTAWVAAQRAELEAQRQLANMALNARQAVARQIAAAYSSDDVQAAISARAVSSVPALLASVGITMGADLAPIGQQNGAESVAERHTEAAPAGQGVTPRPLAEAAPHVNGSGPL